MAARNSLKVEDLDRNQAGEPYQDSLIDRTLDFGSREYWFESNS